MGGHVGQSNTSASLVLVAGRTEAGFLDNLILPAVGTSACSILLITRRTNRFAGLSAHCHRLYLFTLRTFLVHGRIAIASHLVAVVTDPLTGLAVTMNEFALFADAADAFHAITSLAFWIYASLKKSRTYACAPMRNRTSIFSSGG